MIKVFVSKKDNQITAIEVSGHANSDEKGKDLVCAAVTAVVTGAFNSLSNPKDFLIELEDGFARIEVKTSINKHDEIVLEVLLNSLKTIEETNKRFIKII